MSLGYDDRWEKAHPPGCRNTAMFLMMIVIVCLSVIGGLLSRLVG